MTILKAMVLKLEGKAAILAIGTELTTGQITNRNASWLSEKLINLGVEVVLHETVPDDRYWIRNSLERCSQAGQLVFVTGGLGPTTDDFTREVIAEWLGEPLEFDPASWHAIQERLGKLQIPVAESNRQQCYFPRGSRILPNPQGTAPGFTSVLPNLLTKTPAKTHGKLWVLPGPPLEIAAIWDGSVDAELRQILPALKPVQLFTWGCIGKSEAELGEITEKALEGSGLQTGYRVHRPYVEIKVWCPKEKLEEKMGWLQNLEKSLSPWIVTRQGEDLAETLLKKLNPEYRIEIIDAASGALLANRIGPLLRESRYLPLADSITYLAEWNQALSPEEWVQNALQQAEEESITLVVAGFASSAQACIGLRKDDRIQTQNFQSRFLKPELAERRRHEITEIALKHWTLWLDSFQNEMVN